MRVLTPTENHRLNELIGFVGMTIGILVALALISYSPHDPSFNVSAESTDLLPRRLKRDAFRSIRFGIERSR